MNIMTELWKLPKSERNSCSKRKAQLKKRLEENKEALARCKNMVEFFQYQVNSIQKELKTLDIT
jgi:hypothetical protein